MLRLLDVGCLRHPARAVVVAAPGHGQVETRHPCQPEKTQLPGAWRPRQQVPFARHRPGLTRDFEDACAYFATKTDKTAITRILRIDWDTVGRACEREVADGLDPCRLDGLVNIGVDEVSWRGHHRYLTLVTDHVTGTIVWGAGGKDTATLRKLRNRGGDLDPDDTAELADRWCSKASRSGLAPFTKVAKTNRRHRDGILAAIRQKINNAPAEGRRNHVRPITHHPTRIRISFTHRSTRPRHAVLRPHPTQAPTRTSPRMTHIHAGRARKWPSSNSSPTSAGSRPMRWTAQ